MPFVGLLLLNASLGLLASMAAARELRASPRAVLWSQGFNAVAMFEAIVAAPIAAYLLSRFTDWAFGYLVDGVRMPSVALGICVLTYGAVGMVGYVVGAHWLREHRGRHTLTVAAVCAAVATIGAIVCHRRLGLVVTTTEYRGGFGLVSFGASPASTACGLLGSVEVAAAAQLFWTLRSLGPAGN